jgi:hypothetical protein
MENMSEVDFKAFLEGAPMMSRGMHEASQWQRPLIPKFITINKLHVKVKDKGGEEKWIWMRPINNRYDPSGAVRARLAIFDMDIIPERLDQTLAGRIRQEGVIILVYLMCLRYIDDPKERMRWRRGTVIQGIERLTEPRAPQRDVLLNSNSNDRLEILEQADGNSHDSM